MKVLALVPARGKSKGIPNKNLKILFGKPLIQWTIESALQASCIDKLIISTDDKRIAKIAKNLGAEVPFIRPSRLATDSASSVDVVLHALKYLKGYDWLLLLQPTSPIRTTKDIENIFKFCTTHNANSAVSICEVSQHPYKMYKKNKSFYLNSLLKDNFGIKNRVERRQDFPKFYIENGSLYLVKTDWFIKKKKFIDSDTLGFEMPLERSVDLDTMNDWKIAENILKERFDNE